MDFPRVSCGRPSAVVLDLARYRTYLAGPAPSPLLVRMHPKIGRQLELLCELGHANRAGDAGMCQRAIASTGRPDPEPIPEEIVSNRAPRVAALVPAQSDLMACSKTRRTEAVVDSREIHHLLRLWASTRTRHARIAHTDRLDMHMPARTEK
jgi:hypothetical protein